MNSKSLYMGLLIAGMSLGTAWAIRGQFGHEQGAAWGGAIGGLSVLLVAKRADWYSKMFKVTLAAAAGWGISGMVSYGLIVGYGRGIDFVNVYYGLLMLFIIGILYGFIGGGLFGLALADSNKKRVKWHQLIVEMVIGAIIVYFFLIEQLGWLMTPPRSEMWAACLGMAFSLAWFMYRNGQTSAFRVAIFAGLGAGFGFALGNFLQVMGNVAEIKFHFWNVMEYSIGFFGGVGMAYGTFTSYWEPGEDREKRSNVLVPLLSVALIIPFVVWEQSLTMEELIKTFSKLYTGDVTAMAAAVRWISFSAILITCAIWFLLYYRRKASGLITYSYSEVQTFFLVHLGLYAAFSLLETGAFISTYRPEQYLYVVNLLLISLLVGKAKPDFSNRGLNTDRWAMCFALVLVFIALFTLIAINSHGEMNGMNRRFE